MTDTWSGSGKSERHSFVDYRHTHQSPESSKASGFRSSRASGPRVIEAIEVTTALDLGEAGPRGIVVVN